jgi:hypothetical protein
MQYILTEEELLKERETLRAQLDEQAVVSAANMLIKDALWEASGEAITSTPAYVAFVQRVNALRREKQKQFPVDSPIHAYFEELKDSSP